MKRIINEDSRIAEFIRFCVVGFVSACIDALVFYLLNVVTLYQVALIIGYLNGLLFNYVLTIYWTFNQKPTTKNALGVVMAHLINLFIIRMGMMWILVNIYEVSYQKAYIPTIILSLILNYLMVRFAIYKTSK